MATFRGGPSDVSGVVYPTEADLTAAIAAAEASATAAESSATAASSSQAAAAVNLADSETAQTNAETAETNAETAETGALAAQSAGETAQTGAETAETNAETAETNAAAAQAAAEGVYDDFDDRYLGAKASDPTLDNDGDALLEGALYWHTAAPKGLRIYTGSAWISVLDETSADALYQPLDEELTDIAALAPTKGRMIVGNGTAWVDLGVGIDDQVLVADSNEAEGIKWDGRFGGGGGGSLMESVGSSTWTSGNLTLAWSNAPEYDMIEFILSGIRAPLDDYITIRLSSDGGTTWKTTNAYDFKFVVTTTAGSGNNVTEILTGIKSHVSLTTARGYAKVRIYKPHDTAEATLVQGEGTYNSATAIPDYGYFVAEATPEVAYDAISIGGDGHAALDGGKIIAFGYK
jgi:hypothetical protein